MWWKEVHIGKYTPSTYLVDEFPIDGGDFSVVDSIQKNESGIVLDWCRVVAGAWPVMLEA